MRPPVLAHQPLRLQVGGAGIVAAHSLEHFEEFGSRVPGFEYSAQGVTVRAVEQCTFQIVGPRHACQPLGIGQLIGGDWNSLDPQIRMRCLTGRKLDTARSIQRVACRPDGELVTALLQAIRWKGVIALGIACDRDRDCSARLLGADEDALHRAAVAGHLSGKPGLGLGRRDAETCGYECNR